MYVVVPVKVVPAHREALEKFSRKDLAAYARSLGMDPGEKTKRQVINALMLSGKATLCASLGN